VVIKIKQELNLLPLSSGYFWMEAECSSKTAVTTYKAAQCYNPEDNNLNFLHKENLKFHTEAFLLPSCSSESSNLYVCMQWWSSWMNEWMNVCMCVCTYEYYVGIFCIITAWLRENKDGLLSCIQLLCEYNSQIYWNDTGHVLHFYRTALK
jgi:hypothetical protein